MKEESILLEEKNIPTKEKIMIPVRLSKDLYKKVRKKVNNRKDKTRGYSINKYIAELVEENIKEGNNGRTKNSRNG